MAERDGRAGWRGGMAGWGGGGGIATPDVPATCANDHRRCSRASGAPGCRPRGRPGSGAPWDSGRRGSQGERVLGRRERVLGKWGEGSWEGLWEILPPSHVRPACVRCGLGACSRSRMRRGVAPRRMRVRRGPTAVRGGCKVVRRGPARSDVGRPRVRHGCDTGATQFGAVQRAGAVRRGCDAVRRWSDVGATRSGARCDLGRHLDVGRPRHRWRRFQGAGAMVSRPERRRERCVR